MCPLREEEEFARLASLIEEKRSSLLRGIVSISRQVLAVDYPCEEEELACHASIVEENKR